MNRIMMYPLLCHRRKTRVSEMDMFKASALERV